MERSKSNKQPNIEEKKVERNRNVMKRNAHSGLFIFVGNKHQLRSLVRLHIHSLTRSFVHVNLNALMLLSYSIRLLFFHFPFNCVFLTFGGLFFFSSFIDVMYLHLCSALASHMFSPFRTLSLVPLHHFHRKDRKQLWKLCSCSVKIKRSQKKTYTHKQNSK